MFKSIKKRNGQIMPFKIEKITNAIYKASIAVGEQNWQLANNFSKEVVKRLEKKIKKGAIPIIEEVQDAVEQVLIEKIHPRIAKAYILYRQHRMEIRQEKKQILNKIEIDEVDKKFDINALRVLAKRYLLKDESGKIIESPKELFQRVAVHTAIPSLFYDGKIYRKRGGATEHRIEKFDQVKSDGKFSIGKYKLNQFHLEAVKRLYDCLARQGKMKIPWSGFLAFLKKGYFNKYENEIDIYYDLMVERRFLPNTPALANFGNHLGMGSACFSLDIEDSIKSIMDTLKSAALIFKCGGGVGYNFSKLRPEGDFVKTTSGVSSGPISFMAMFDTMTDVIKQGAMRRGANMGILNSDHPDIEKFIHAKEGNKALRNFNISVMLKPEFWEAFKENKSYKLINPRTGKTVQEIDAKKLFDEIAFQAWESAEPGVLFFDRINEYNPFLKSLGPIEATNPCVVGSTLVAVADGRNYVSIKQLVDEKKDVSVYCYGNDRVQIRTGRFPRKTRENVPVWKVTLDDGSYIIATADHKFRGRNNQEIQLKDLKSGTSLMPFYKFQYTATGKRTSYWGITLNNGERATAEHRMITEFYFNREIQKYPLEVVHHKNCNGLDNRFENLEILSDNKHNSFHQTGEKNVMKGKWWQQLSDEEKKRHKEKMSLVVKGANNGMFGKKHKKETLRKLSEIQKRHFSDLGNRVRHQEIMRQIMADPVIRQKISQALTKYKFIMVNCLECGQIFTKKENKPKEFCSHSCASSYINQRRSTENFKMTFRKKREGRRNTLYDLGTQFIERNNQIPTYQEFRRWANQYKTSGDLRSTFGGYTKFKEELELHNHKVISVEFYGYEDVYNITVDDFHTVAYITNPNTQTKFSKKPLISGIITSQCSELPLYPNESCNLGSLNVWAYLKKNSDKKPQFDWQKLGQDVKIATRFLDNVVDINKYPLEEIKEMTLNTRKLGLGIMGMGNLLCELEISFGSHQGLKFMEKLMEFINYYSKETSINLSKERGRMPYFDKSFYKEGKLPFAGFKDKKSWRFDWLALTKKIKKYGIRNAGTTTIAPTGSISMLAGCSSGIEPIFSLVFEKNITIGNFYYIDPVFEEQMKKVGLMDEDLIKNTACLNGSINNISYIPEKYKKIFVTAMDIAPVDHIKVLAAFQKWVDSAISKTNNFPAEATIDDIKKVYLLAYELGCKGVTVYRDKSLHTQVLIAGSTKKNPKDISKLSIIQKDEKTKGFVVYQTAGVKNNFGDLNLTQAISEKNENNNSNKKELKECPSCKTELAKQEGCIKCLACGWGMCSS